MSPRATILLAELHAAPALAVEVFHSIKIATEWQAISDQEWVRYSLAFTGDLDAFGKERPIGRVFLGADGKWHSPAVETHFPTPVAARFAIDALLQPHWVLVDPQEMQW